MSVGNMPEKTSLDMDQDAKVTSRDATLILQQRGESLRKECVGRAMGHEGMPRMQHLIDAQLSPNPAS